VQAAKFLHLVGASSLLNTFHLLPLHLLPLLPPSSFVVVVVVVVGVGVGVVVVCCS
jgi:hypothetical protein